ncbi:MAG TPA: hypothetical protein VGH99_13275 [Pseudonocardia sp.]|jgi:hypothetical protein
MNTETFPFRFSTAYRIAGLPFGVTPGRCRVELDGGTLTTRFGPWTVRTEVANGPTGL